MTITNSLPGSCPASNMSDAERHSLERRLASLADAGAAAIEDRLVKIDREWTVGRCTKVTLGGLIVLGMVLAATVGVWWLILPGVAAVLLLQYFFTHMSWLAILFHNMGFRCGSEVEHEKIALKVLRGDFRTVPTMHDVENRDDISRLEGEGGLVLEPDTTKVDPVEAARQVLTATERV